MANKRADILNVFKVDERGVIRSPGKFEGEMLYAPYFYVTWLDGGADDTLHDGDTEISVFHVTDDDRKEFPELANVGTVHLWETVQGFVTVQTFTRKK